ncbi:unnamed protein product [Ixodes pacificus]
MPPQPRTGRAARGSGLAPPTTTTAAEGAAPAPAPFRCCPRVKTEEQAAIPVPLSTPVRIHAPVRFKGAAVAATTATAEPPPTAAGTRPAARPTTTGELDR